HLYNVMPGASVITLISMFGSPGGGGSSAAYQPVIPWTGAEILGGCAVACLALALILVLRRAITAPARRRLIRPRARPAGRRPGPLALARVGACGTLASLRSELLVMS